MQECLVSSSTIHMLLAQTHGKLGWDNFVEGRICEMMDLEVVVNTFSRQSGVTPERWGWKFISKITQATHRQWLFCNSHVHYKKLEGLTEAQY